MRVKATVLPISSRLFTQPSMQHNVLEGFRFEELALTTAFVCFAWNECKQRAERMKCISRETYIFGDIRLFSFLPVGGIHPSFAL
jgi:hypothetical protein